MARLLLLVAIELANIFYIRPSSVKILPFERPFRQLANRCRSDLCKRSATIMLVILSVVEIQLFLEVYRGDYLPAVLLVRHLITSSFDLQELYYCLICM